MTPAASPAILTAIDELEGKARLFETQAGEYRDLAGTLRRTFAVSTLADSPPPPAAPPALFGSKVAKVRITPTKPPATVAGPTRLLTVAILEFLGRQPGPIAPRVLVDALQRDPATVRRAVDELVALGKVTRTGVTQSTRIALLGGQPAAVPLPPAPAPESSPRSGRGGAHLDLVGQINTILGKGASVTAREVLRQVTGAADITDVTRALEQMAAGGSVERIPVGETVRFRKRGRA